MNNNIFFLLFFVLYSCINTKKVPNQNLYIEEQTWILDSIDTVDIFNLLELKFSSIHKNKYYTLAITNLDSVPAYSVLHNAPTLKRDNWYLILPESKNKYEIFENDLPQGEIFFEWKVFQPYKDRTTTSLRLSHLNNMLYEDPYFNMSSLHDMFFEDGINSVFFNSVSTFEIKNNKLYFYSKNEEHSLVFIQK